jgi:DNA-directed RNA polymerase subunit K/omega
MQPTNPLIRIEIQTNGRQVPRLVKDHRYDSSTIEGRTGQRASEVIGTRYDAVLIIANRIRQLNQGEAPKIDRKYGVATTAIQEVEQGLVGYELFGRVIRPRRNRSENYTTSTYLNK